MEEDRAHIELALLNRSEDARQHRVGVGAALASIAAADLAYHDGGTKGVFGAPVGRIDGIGLEEEREDRGAFDREVRRESARHARGPRVIEQRVEAILQTPAGDGDTLRGDAPLLIPIADAEGLLEDPLDVRGELALLMSADQGATAAQPMRETGLVQRLFEPPIGPAAVTHEDAAEIGAEQRRGPLQPFHRLVHRAHPAQPEPDGGTEVEIDQCSRPDDFGRGVHARAAGRAPSRATR